MPRRSRSRSPRRDRDRGRDRSRDRDRRDRDRGGRRDYEPRGERDRDERLRDDRSRGERFSRRSRSPVDRFRVAPGSSTTTTPKPLKEEQKRFTAADFAGKSEEEIEMMKCMGFGGFDTTKGKKVDGNDVGAVHVKLKRTYRQYMNRRGGFNRPLDAVH